MSWSYWDRGAISDPNWTQNLDDAWPAGRGPLGYGESYLATTVGYGPDPAHKHITTYFRNRTFIIEQEQEIEHIFADVMYDDGFVLYIEGQRVYSAGLSNTNPMSPTELAVGHEAENRYERIDLTPYRHFFDRGYVDLAVEVHQSEPSSSDLVFDMKVEIVHTQQTAGVAIARGATWTYWDQYSALSGWQGRFYNPSGWGVATAPLGYGESYIASEIQRPTATSQGPTTLYRRLFDVEDPAAITELTGEVLYDDGVAIWLNGTRIDSLSMPPGEPTFQTLALGHEAEARYETRDWTQFRHLLVEHENVLAVELHQVDRTSSDAVFDVALTFRTSSPPPVPTEDIPRGATWTYWDRGGDQGTAWRAPSFDDSSWRRNVAPLGYGESYLATTIEFGPDPNHKYRTTYFRNRFRVTDRTQVTALVADLMYDDGAVIYVNGTEVKRVFMPAGTITATTLASSHETGNNYERHDLSAARSLLVNGDNVITVEVHQSSDSSSDLTFDLALDVTTGGPPPPPPAPGIARGSSWRYLASPVAPACCGWDDPSYDDDQWPLLPGPLGYGESYIRSTIPFGPDPTKKFMTTYFRSEFFVEDPKRVNKLLVELMYDDGAIVYLNGQRVLERGLSGFVTHDTPALWHEANNTYETFDLSSAIVALAPGVNTVAVEVHQESPSSSDLVFDLALRYETRAPDPVITRNSTWLYSDEGPLAAGWQTSSDTRGWKASDRAPIGYHNDDVWFETIRQPVTTYFRRPFTVISPAAVTELRGELLVDDGAVIYLNGTEIARPHMPTGAVTFDTRAASHESDGKYERLDLTAHRGLLRAGENVIAIEVHQDAAHTTPGSSANDMTFDFAIEPIEADTLRIPGCTPVTPNFDGSLTGVWIAPGGAVWAAGSSGVIARRTASGWAWCRAELNVGHGAVWGMADDAIWFVGTGGVVQRWNGTSFERVDIGTTVDLVDIWGSSESDIFVVGTGGAIRHFDGVAWRDVSVMFGGVNAVWGASADDVWVVGRANTPATEDHEYICHNTIFRWNAAAGTFDLEEDISGERTGCGLDGIGGSGPTDVWAVGDFFPDGAAAGFAFAAHYDGVQWSDVTSPDEEHSIDRVYTDVAAHAPGAENGAWIVSAGRGAVRWDGTKWDGADDDLTSDLSSVDVRGSLMFAVGRNNKVVRWDGTGWTKDN